MGNDILKQMLDDVDNKYDKREGSFIYDALAPVSNQFVRTNENINIVKQKLSIENLVGDELSQRVKENTGVIERRQATRAIGVVTVTGTGTINEGDLFETENGVQFEGTETKEIVESGDVNIRAIVAGHSGEVSAQTITLFPVTLSGLTSVTNAEPTYDGFTQETDGDLLQRYYQHKRTPSTSGNKAHYISWAKEIEGVGEVKVFPLWDGDNTVKVIIIDSNRSPASIELVASVQEHIDPETQGLGEGKAPIGAFVTVESASALEINIQMDVALSEGVTLIDAQSNIEESLTNYFSEIAFKEDVVSYARLGASVLNSAGVTDYQNLEINGGTSNISIGANEVAVLGMVTVHEL